jgi:hypothetical protein
MLGGKIYRGTGPAPACGSMSSTAIVPSSVQLFCERDPRWAAGYSDCRCAPCVEVRRERERKT